MNAATFIVAVIVILIIGGAAYRVFRMFTSKGSSCGCCKGDCCGCSRNINCEVREEEKK